MNEFWLWFWRPVAEFLGQVFLLAVIFAIIAVVFTVVHWRGRS